MKFDRSKQLITNLFIAFISSVISIIVIFSLGEVITRKLNLLDSLLPYKENLVYKPSSIQGLLYELKPSININRMGTVIKTNSKGLRDYEFLGKKPEGVFRIIVLGDSITEGHAIDIEKTYPKKIEKLLNKGNPSRKYEVINCGVTGYNTFQELIFLKQKGIKYQPDLVIVGFCPNDIMKPFILKSTGFVTAKKVIKVSFKNPKYFLKSLYLRFETFLQQNSRLYKFLYIRIKRVELEPDADRLRKHYNSILKLARLIAFSRKNNCEILVIYFPYKNELDTIDLRKPMPREIIKNFCGKKNISLVDLTEIFLKKSKKESVELYLPGDITHLNEKGNKVVAESVCQLLISEKLIN
jgi:lysophospholipase L1-like esterase